EDQEGRPGRHEGGPGGESLRGRAERDHVLAPDGGRHRDLSNSVTGSEASSTLNPKLPRRPGQGTVGAVAPARGRDRAGWRDHGRHPGKSTGAPVGAPAFPPCQWRGGTPRVRVRLLRSGNGDGQAVLADVTADLVLVAVVHHELH